MRNRFTAFLHNVSGLIALLSPCVYFALEFLGATYTPRSSLMQSLSIWLLIFWYCVAIIFGVRTLMHDRQATKSTQKKEGP